MRMPKFRKKSEPTTYRDYLHTTWGHSCLVQAPKPDGTRAACIFGPRPSAGDVVLMRSHTIDPDTGRNGVLQYRVVGEVNTPADPGDQHFCSLRFMEKETNKAGGKDPRSSTFQRSWALHGDLL